MQNYVQNGTTSYIKPQSQAQPQTQTNPQQVAPNYAGVHISIINPMVNPTTGKITYPTQTTSAYDAGSQGGCYPASYYTTQPGTTFHPPVTNINSGNKAPGGFYDETGKYHPYVSQNGQTGYYNDNGGFVPVNTVSTTTVQPKPEDKTEDKTVTTPHNTNGFVDKDGKFRPYVKDSNGQIGYYDDKGVFHPVDPNNNPEARQGQTTPNGFIDKDGKFRPYVKDSNGQIGYYDDKGVFHPVDPNNNPEAKQGQTTPNGFIDKDGKFRPYVKDSNGQIGYYDDKGVFHPVDPNNNPEAGFQATPNGFTDKDGKFRPYVKDANGQIGYYDDNGVFHPVDPNNNPDAIQNTDAKGQGTNNEVNNEVNNNKETKTSSTTDKENSEDSKTKTKKIVKLDDNYIKTLENYLNSQDTEVRKMGAKEVSDRIVEDSSRNDDPALTALVNKMLQDPSSSIRAIALSLLESRSIQGNDLTVKLLKKMQSSDSGFGMDSTQATSTLLKMAGKVVEKEVPAEETKKETAKK